MFTFGLLLFSSAITYVIAGSRLRGREIILCLALAFIGLCATQAGGPRRDRAPAQAAPDVTYSRMGLHAAAYPEAADAVDGYKDIKFGITADQLRALNKCTLTRGKQDEKSLDQMFCYDFKVGSEPSTAKFYFAEDRLARISLEFSGALSEVQQFTNVLNQTYGPPSSYPGSDDYYLFNNFKQPTLDHGWAKDSVVMRMAWGPLPADFPKWKPGSTMLIIYTSPRDHLKIQSRRGDRLKGFL
jgi:hypothetical protein